MIDLIDRIYMIMILCIRTNIHRKYVIGFIKNGRISIWYILPKVSKTLERLCITSIEDEKNYIMKQFLNRIYLINRVI